MFLREGDLWAIRFDPDRLEVRGEAVPVEQGIRVEPGGAVQLAAAADGSLVYLPGGTKMQTLVWVDRQGRETPTPVPPRAYTSLRISPDGARVALEIWDQEYDIWIWDLAHAGPLTRLTFGRATDRHPVWTPDGRQVVFGQ